MTTTMEFQRACHRIRLAVNSSIHDARFVVQVLTPACDIQAGVRHMNQKHQVAEVL